MTSALWAFIKERFQLKATIPLSMVLFGAPFALASFGMIDFAVGAASTFMALLCVRIADDLASAHTDAIRHPQRGLVCGRISAPLLSMALAAVFCVLVLINLALGVKAVGWPAMGIYYALFFRSRRHLHLLVRPLFSNVVFLMIPLYAAGTVREALLMGLFAWTAAVAHEYGHSVHAADEGHAHAVGYSDLLGPRSAAILATGAFGLSLAFGLLFWNQSGRTALFLILLVAVALHLALLCLRLIRRPCADNAKPLYVSGFIFFLLPYLGFIIDTLWKV